MYITLNNFAGTVFMLEMQFIWKMFRVPCNSRPHVHIRSCPWYCILEFLLVYLRGEQKNRGRIYPQGAVRQTGDFH